MPRCLEEAGFYFFYKQIVLPQITAAPEVFSVPVIIRFPDVEIASLSMNYQVLIRVHGHNSESR
jgi:hypothetical protein